jgi:hypothetical protein
VIPLDPLDEAKRPGADRVADQVTASTVADDVVGALRAKGGEGQLLEEGSVGPVEGETDGEGINAFDRGEQTLGS